MLLDLHCHTTSSDGFLSPEQIVYMAIDKGLNYLAITDHDTLDGCKIACQLVKERNLPLTLINGVELSVDTKTKDVDFHLLGLNVDINSKALNDKLQELAINRTNRVHKIVERLNSLGYDINAKDIFDNYAGKKTFGRAHIAACLVEKGYFKTVALVFEELLYTGGPAYVAHLKPTIKEAIDLIKASGGISIIAHPALIKNQQFIYDAIKLGVDGLEVYYPTHTIEQVEHYKKMALDNNLKISGGSDFHALAGRYPSSLGFYCICANNINLW